MSENLFWNVAVGSVLNLNILISCALLWWTVHWVIISENLSLTLLQISILKNVTPHSCMKSLWSIMKFWYLLQVILDVNECLKNYEIKYKDVDYLLLLNRIQFYFNIGFWKVYSIKITISGERIFYCFWPVMRGIFPISFFQ